MKSLLLSSVYLLVDRMGASVTRFRFVVVMAGAIVTVAATVTQAAAASFDCSNARKPDELAICRHQRLSELDAEMAALWFAYRRVPMLMGANGARQDAAAEFLRRRAACGSNIGCLRRLYVARIRALKQDLDRAMKAIEQEENRVPSTLPTLPAPIEAIIEGYRDQCRQLGGTLADAATRPEIMTGDLDGDGKPDYVLNPQNLRCSAAKTAFCGNGGCRIIIAVSSNNYQPIAVLGGQPTLVQKADGTDVEIWVHHTDCQADAGQACWATFAWVDGKVHKTYQVRSQHD